MPSYTMVHIKMQRDSTNTPWGFRMQGGRDFACPLQIQQVNPSSLAERVGICVDDYIIRIGSLSTEYLTHQQAQEQIKSYANFLELVLQRGAPPIPVASNNRIESAAKPSSSSQMIMPISNNQVLVNQSFNTPIGLYSTNSINETIAHTLKSVNVSLTDDKFEQPKNVNHFPTTLTKPVSTVKVLDSCSQSHPTPYASTSPKAMGFAKMSTTGTKIGSGSPQKIAKGSALLNRNDNNNQLAICFTCGIRIRGPFISAISRCYCVDHFTCSHCSVDLIDCGFVEDHGKLYCEKDFENFLAPCCAKCQDKILKECVRALEKTWHPECFLCAICQKSIGTGSFHVEEGLPYCIEDYRRLFQVKCTGCEFPIEAGDKYLEAMGGVYHAECFNCSTCQVSLDGQGFVVKNNRPYCRQHAGRQVLSLFG